MRCVVIRSVRAFVVSASLGALACSSSEGASSLTVDAGTDAASDAGFDAGPDGAAIAAGCLAQRTPRSAPVCGNDCDVRLYLPAGDSYCTMTCATNAGCAALGPGLVCSAGMGTCAPACVATSECIALGFKTCDGAGACDTQ
jgi:hypothetical protein